MDTEFQPIKSDTNQIDVYNEFKTRDLFSAPVVNETNLLVGRITVDDIIEIAADEVEQDFIGFAQIEEDVFASQKNLFKMTCLAVSKSISNYCICINKFVCRCF